ncbi:MAG: hypothetical protein COB02_05335 [Candidatus Cloacimonadota bacterium]|nr:MAG: hypothetical protein COB02_05335 [Candidatus Cloacimonadota bacterium]
METIVYQNKEIQFEIKHSKRRTLGIKISGDGSILARSPMGLIKSEVIDFIKSNGSWILKQLKKLESSRVSKTYTNDYKNNEIHRFLGQSYPLQISLAKKRGVTLFQNSLYLKSPTPDDTNDIKKVLQKFYKSQASLIFPKIIDKCWLLFEKYKLKTPIYRYRLMKRKWGTCRQDGLVTLNIELIKEDIKSIEYVIIHEMCHLIVPNHSKNFYDLMDLILPNHKETESILDKTII